MQVARQRVLNTARVTDSTSSGGVNPENDQDDEMAIEKQRLDIIEVLSLMPVTREMWLLSFIYQKTT